MSILILLVHIGVCIMLIMVVLLQSGKAADLAGAFGGGGSQTALGSRGAATFFTKATTTCAVLFMMTSLGLALVGSRRGATVLESLPGEVTAPAPLPPVDDAAALPAAVPAVTDDAAQDADGGVDGLTVEQEPAADGADQGSSDGGSGGSADEPAERE